MNYGLQHLPANCPAAAFCGSSNNNKSNATIVIVACQEEQALTNTVTGTHAQTSEGGRGCGGSECAKCVYGFNDTLLQFSAVMMMMSIDPVHIGWLLLKATLTCG